MFKEENIKKQKKVLLGVTASIALYKACDLIRLFTKQGYQVQVILTKTAAEWISPLVFKALSGNDVIFPQSGHLQEEGLSMPHIDVRQDVDVFLIAPATADCIARAAIGRADDPLCAALLSFNGKKMFAPAMNPFMYAHAATQKNIQTLKDYGYEILTPSSGESVCGDQGEGKMMPVEEIFARVKTAL